MAAIIFDMDGVISDTQQVWSDVGALVLRRHGSRITPERITRTYAGVPPQAMIAQELPAEDAAALEREILTLMEIRLREDVPVIPDALPVIRALHREGNVLAIASGSPVDFIRTVLDTLGIRECFAAIASGYEVDEGKPAPDVFLLAAQRLGVPPGSCIVIEDGRAGIEAAHRAGMSVIAFNAPDAEAHAHITALRELPLAIAELTGDL